MHEAGTVEPGRGCHWSAAFLLQPLFHSPSSTCRTSSKVPQCLFLRFLTSTAIIFVNQISSTQTETQSWILTCLQRTELLWKRRTLIIQRAHVSFQLAGLIISGSIIRAAESYLKWAAMLISMTCKIKAAGNSNLIFANKVGRLQAIKMSRWKSVLGQETEP